jgi:hypothetical protein
MMDRTRIAQELLLAARDLIGNAAARQELFRRIIRDPSATRATLANLKRRRYDRRVALKAFKYVAEDAAADYMKNEGLTGDVEDVFPRTDITSVAERLRDHYEDQIIG